MRNILRVSSLFVAVFLAVACLPACDDGGESKGPDYQITMFGLNDRHSNWWGRPNCSYTSQLGDGTVGGADRWVKLVKDERATNDNVLLLDAGDFSQGHPMVAAENYAGELNMMKHLGFDAAALGNHEFDFGEGVLAQIVAAAEEPAVPLLCANINFSSESSDDDTLEALYGNQGEAGKKIFPHVVVDLPNGGKTIKVGIFGLMGLKAAYVGNQTAVTFSKNMDDMAATAQAQVDILRDEKKADLVILVAHLGLTLEPDGGVSYETADLAKMVEGIDVIVSGHNHTTVPQGVAVPCEKADSDWSTLVMEAGTKNMKIGRYSLTRTGGVKTASSELIYIDDTLEADPETTTLINALAGDLEATFLGQYPQVPEAGAFLTGELLQNINTSPCDLPRHCHENHNLGYLVADTVAEVTGAEIAVISSGGDLRSSIERCAGDQIDLADMFIAVPLGIGLDGLLGYPLVKFYLPWQAFKLILEATVADVAFSDCDYSLNLSGMRVEMDTSSMQYARIKKITQYNPLDESDAGTTIFEYGAGNSGWHVDPQELVSVAVTRYIAGFLGSFNLVPQDETGATVVKADGTPDWDSLILHDGDNREYKLWYITAQKLASFQGGLPLQYCDDNNPFGPYWRRVCDLNPNNEYGHNCP